MKLKFYRRSRLTPGGVALFSALLLTGLGLSLTAQTTYTPYHFVTIAGTAGATGHLDATGAAAQFSSPIGIAVDATGNVYVADNGNDTIRQITAAGVVTTIVGLAGSAGNTDGAGSAAQLSHPNSLAIDRAGNLYVADTANLDIRKITPTTVGGVTTWTITSIHATQSGFGNLQNFPVGVAVDTSGNLFFTNVLSILPDSVLWELPQGASGPSLQLAGSNGGGYGYRNGTGNNALFDAASSVAVDGNGVIYEADTGNSAIRRLTQATAGGLATATVLAGGTAGLGTAGLQSGSAGTPGSADATGTAARFNQPKGVAVDLNGNVFVADTGNNTIREITPAGVVTTLGGMPGVTGSADGTGPAAQFNQPDGIAVDAHGNVYVTDEGNNTIRMGSPPPVAPVITLQPVSATVAGSHSAAFSVAASGFPAPTYQWSLNGAPIAGATDPILLVGGTTAASAGAYTCTATNSVSSVTSNAASLTVNTTASNPGYLINLSARAAVGTGDNILIGGFGVGGTGTKQLLIRGVGPALSAFFNTELVTPQLVLLDNSGAIVATNIGWGNAPVAGPSTASEAPFDATTNLMNTLGAYTINPGSADTAMVLTMPAGNNTAQISGVAGTSGIALCEIYDADAVSPPSARLINISARADVGTGDNILIGGFAIGGATAETVLIRAVGPGLNDELPGVFPLSAVLNQPVLTILNGAGAAIYGNTVWGGDATLAAAFTATGAFSLNPAHADSVLLITLPPGNYTAQVSGLNSGTGIALCEIYEVP